MTERVSAYDIQNNPTRAWNVFADEISHLHNDLDIMRNNKDRVGSMPNDVFSRLRDLWTIIGMTLVRK